MKSAAPPVVATSPHAPSRRSRAQLVWERYREIGMRYAIGLVDAVLAAAMEAGQLTSRPVRPLAHLLIGAMEEAALTAFLAGLRA